LSVPAVRGQGPIDPAQAVLRVARLTVGSGQKHVTCCL
jgi:hypothetical protein